MLRKSCNIGGTSHTKGLGRSDEKIPLRKFSNEIQFVPLFPSKTGTKSDELASRPFI